MEGPSLFLAAVQLKPFIGKKITGVSGNTKFGKERLLNKKVIDIFAWGKHLVFQFDTFAFRIHFLMFGSFEATVNKEKVTGDYPRKNRPIRLQLDFKNGEILFYSPSLKWIESGRAKDDYDYSVDVMSEMWDAKKALQKVQSQPESLIADVLLDQTIFAGVGNIIKNEVLFLTKTSPLSSVLDIPLKTLKLIIKTAKKFSWQFYEWRKIFELKKHYTIYRKSICPVCQGKITKNWLGERHRVSYFCPKCQPL